VAEPELNGGELADLESALAQHTAEADAEQRALGNPGPAGFEVAVSPGPGLGQVGAEALGSLTGAPPHTRTTKVMVAPFNGNREPVRIVSATRQSRVVTLTAPAVGFGIFVGGSDVEPGVGVQLPPIIPYDFILPGYQELYAVTDAPVFLPLQLQIAPLLIGDRERRFSE
jgi:hypothetical protein